MARREGEKNNRLSIDVTVSFEVTNQKAFNHSRKTYQISRAKKGVSAMCESRDMLGGGGGGGQGVRTSRLPPFFAFLPSPSKLEGFKTRISHKAVPGRTTRRPFIIHFYYIYFD